MARKGKYAEVMGKLPKLPFEHENPKYQELVLMRKGQLAVELETPGMAAIRWRDLRRQEEELKERLSNLGVELEATKLLVIEHYEQAGITGTRLTDDGSSIDKQEEPYATVEDAEAYRRWCLEDEDLSRKMTLPWATTNSLAKTRLLEGEAPPPGIGLFLKPKLVWRKG